jgi:hypothetical protein
LNRKTRRDDRDSRKSNHGWYLSVAAGKMSVVSTAQPETFITEELLGLVGKTLRTAQSFPVSKSDIRKWAMAIYYPERPPRLFWDEEYAATTRWKGIVAPQELNPFAWMARQPEPPERQPAPVAGQHVRFGDFEKTLGVEPPPYRAVLQSRVIANYGKVRIRPDDVIRSESCISEYWEREGRMGLQLYTTISDNLYNQHGDWIKRLDTVFVRYL